MEDCLFCNIVAGKVDAQIVDEGDDWVAFRDVAPKAPVHVLVIPKEHSKNISEIKDTALLGRLMQATIQVAQKEGLEEDGYRIVNNLGKYGGQAVFHTHIHILGKRPMGWPPG